MDVSLTISDQPDPGGATLAQRKSSSMRNVNSRMREDSASLAPSDSIPFFCECESPTCYSSIWISVADFDAVVVAETGWLLVEGHEPSAAWQPREASPTRETMRSAPERPSADLEASRPIGAHWGFLFHRRLAKSASMADAAA